jgi:hypothetical protein
VTRAVVKESGEADRQARDLITQNDQLTVLPCHGGRESGGVDVLAITKPRDPVATPGCLFRSLGGLAGDHLSR